MTAEGAQTGSVVAVDAVGAIVRVQTAATNGLAVGDEVMLSGLSCSSCSAGEVGLLAMPHKVVRVTATDIELPLEMPGLSVSLSSATWARSDVLRYTASATATGDYHVCMGAISAGILRVSPPAQMVVAQIYLTSSEPAVPAPIIVNVKTTANTGLPNAELRVSFVAPNELTLLAVSIAVSVTRREGLVGR